MGLFFKKLSLFLFNQTIFFVLDPYDYFVLDSVTGELKTGKSLDREALIDNSAPINLTVRVRDIKSSYF